MNNLVANEIPDIVISRLPVYLRILSQMSEDGGKLTTSSKELGQKLGISSAQIRKDLSHFGEFGKQGTGYHIAYLIDQLRQILHLQREWSVVLIGAGYLGHALAHYDGFRHRGFRIAWIFDNDPAKVGEMMGGVTVQPMEALEPIMGQEGAQVAILAVPAEAAQMIADQLVASGIKAILSYAPINLNVPAGVRVEYSDPVLQLQTMSYYLQATDNIDILGYPVSGKKSQVSLKIDW